MNTYRDGKIAPNGACKVGDKLRRIPGFGGHIPGADSAPATRNFVSGEKFWLTKIDVRDTGKERGVVLDFFSDAINDVRFRGALTIPFGAVMPSPEEALKAVAEVITVAPSDDKNADDKGGDKGQAGPQGGQQEAPAPSQAEAPPPPIEAPPPPIEAPPPPQADPTSISEGQTIDQVVAALGQPVKKAKVGTKDIYYYKDLKITFVNGKVTDVQ
jgi:hypothetical protein